MQRPTALDWLIYRIFRWWWNPIFRANPDLTYRLEMAFRHHRLKDYQFADEPHVCELNQAMDGVCMVCGQRSNAEVTGGPLAARPVD